MNTTPSAAVRPATMTRKELFRMFLEAPVYDTGSRAFPAPATVSDYCFGDAFVGELDHLLPDCGFNLKSLIIEKLLNADDPDEELFIIIAEIGGIAKSLQILRDEFDKLRTIAQMPDPPPGASAEEWRHWNETDEYHLPTPLARADDVSWLDGDDDGED